MERTKIDGVTVLWELGPPPLRATLTFGCGTRDESFRTIGVTHLVEHLAMSKLPRVHHERNASVDLVSTSFTAAGRPEQLVAFLKGVCWALDDLPVDRIDREAGVLAAEGGLATHPTVAALLTQRFGIQGPGLAPWTGPGYDRLTPAMVREHAERYFVADNAVLALTGPPPADLRLPLPAGPRPAPAPVTPTATTGPLWFEGPCPSVGAALLATANAAWAIGMAVLAERLEQIARHDRGLSYEVGLETVPVDGEHRVHSVTVDARDGKEHQVAELLWAELRRMATEGPTQAELDHERGAARETYADPRYTEVELDRAAAAEVLGYEYRDREQRLRELAAVRSEEVRDAFAAAEDSVHLVVPFDVRPNLPDLAQGGCSRTRELPPGRVFRPSLLARIRAREARALRLILTADGVAMRDPDGDVHETRFADVVGVEEYGGERVVFGRNGCRIFVDPEIFAGAEAAVRAVDEAVSAQLRYQRSAFGEPD